MPKPKWSNFSDEELAQFVAESHNFVDLLTKLGYNPYSGSARLSIKKMLLDKQLDYSHFTGNTVKQNELLSSSVYLKKRLYELRGYKCESCGLTQWLDQSIPLELHHKDGNRNNNDLNNLILLCPNCHALTDNYRGKNHKNQTVSDDEFLQALLHSSSINEACIKVGLCSNQSSYNRAHKLLKKCY